MEKKSAARAASVLIACFAVIGAGVAGSEEPQGRWVTDPASSCALFSRKPQDQETVSWSGACQDGHATGGGSAVWRYSEDGKEKIQIIDGQFSDGRLSGKATVAVEGGRYEGYFVDGKAYGRVTWTADDGQVYEGTIKDNKPHGAGTLVRPNGDEYRGDFKEGGPTGQGVWIFSSGVRYEGEVVLGAANGQGELTDAGGNRYEGHFRGNQMDGIGVLSMANGITYEGEFAAGELHGLGVLTLDNRALYEGTFANNQFDGLGRLTLEDGSVLHTMFSNNQLIKGVFESASGSDLDLQYNTQMQQFSVHTSQGATGIFILSADGQYVLDRCMGDGLADAFCVQMGQFLQSIENLFGIVKSMLP